MISRVELPANKTAESAAEREEKDCRITETSLDKSREEFDYKLSKLYRLPCNINEKSLKKAGTQAFKYHIYKFRIGHFREYLFVKKKTDIFNTPNKNVNFHVSLTKYRYRYFTWNGKVKFSFSNFHKNLNIKLFR